jgi:hypothetical protein
LVPKIYITDDVAEAEQERCQSRFLSPLPPPRPRGSFFFLFNIKIFAKLVVNVLKKGSGQQHKP